MGKKETLCWSCQNACGKCTWSKNFKKVKGWEAKKTVIKGDPNGNEPDIKSYRIISCPLYIPDSISEKITHYQVARWLGINIRTYYRMFTKKDKEINKAKYFEYLLNKRIRG